MLVALLIWISSGRPIPFQQQRLGYQGRPFAFYKFRTMSVDAEARRDELLHLKQTYWTADTYKRVIDFYVGYTAKEEGWTGTPSRSGYSTWSKNLTIDSRMTGGLPGDKTQPGSAVVVMQEESRTLIITFATLPRPAS